MVKFQRKRYDSRKIIIWILKIIVWSSLNVTIKDDAFGSDKIVYSNDITKITLPENVTINETNIHSMGKYGAGFKAAYKNVISGGKGTYTCNPFSRLPRSKQLE
ncbi:hypothetical protein [Acetobacterium tundrae]|uniref:Uncharacterized protein n=1 Tax=Acetobacterium tundrae TaxID=132932 RepID=A0ABR6WPY5_9FIRM|nr:hypothetical protein [Acetobacterium tundrae]MBC3798511.1 hypothetical protein [Acetobacterium tundrae]